MAGRYEQTLALSQRACRLPNARLAAFVTAICALVRLQRVDEAKVVMTELLARFPEAHLARTRHAFAWVFPRNPEMVEDIVQAVAEAGMPE